MPKDAEKNIKEKFLIFFEIHNMEGEEQIHRWTPDGGNCISNEGISRAWK